uniref:Uncharacterized protein n=1 Tax=Knipowitschia caucasica TaxID=637954 RepID=A0AAV2KZT3_KNICA
MAASNYFGFSHGAGQYSTQPPQGYSHPSTGSYSVQQAPAVAQAVTAASYSAPPIQAARQVASSPYPTYQSHQSLPEYTYRQPDPPAPPQPTTTPQPYQDSYNYARPAAVTSYENKQYYQTSNTTAQRTATENYYQTVGVKSAYNPIPSTVYSQPPPPQSIHQCPAAPNHNFILQLRFFFQSHCISHILFRH